MDHIDWRPYLKECNKLAQESVAKGNTPFGAVLVSPDGEILMRQGNVELTEHKATGHAETQLAEKASQNFTKEYLRCCTLVTSVEPCCMCAGAIYWSGIGRVVFGLTEKELLSMTIGNAVNPTFDLSCREVFAAGQRKVEVIGPIIDMQEELSQVHSSYWS